MRHRNLISFLLSLLLLVIASCSAEETPGGLIPDIPAKNGGDRQVV